MTKNDVTHSLILFRYCTHVYFNFGGKQTKADWDAAFGYLAPTYPLIATEFGNCKRHRGNTEEEIHTDRAYRPRNRQTEVLLHVTDSLSLFLLR